MPHSWDENTPVKGYSTCNNCGQTEKTWKIRKRGGLPSCEEYKQTKLTEEPPCGSGKPPLICMNCRGRLDEKTCNSLRERLKIFNLVKHP